MVLWGLSGCTKKPNTEETGKLEEARSAAESAERKLSELRQERIALEQQLQGKQKELDGQKEELNSLNADSEGATE
jgi:flagellar biosynthesis chaperone FliJ